MYLLEWQVRPIQVLLRVMVCCTTMPWRLVPICIKLIYFFNVIFISLIVLLSSHDFINVVSHLVLKTTNDPMHLSNCFIMYLTVIIVLLRHIFLGILWEFEYFMTEKKSDMIKYIGIERFNARNWIAWPVLYIRGKMPLLMRNGMSLLNALLAKKNFANHFYSGLATCFHYILLHTYEHTKW